VTRENPVKLAAANAAKTLASIIQRAVKGFFLTQERPRPEALGAQCRTCLGQSEKPAERQALLVKKVLCAIQFLSAILSGFLVQIKEPIRDLSTPNPTGIAVVRPLSAARHYRYNRHDARTPGETGCC
jgi:hypothetical protein